MIIKIGVGKCWYCLPTAKQQLRVAGLVAEPGHTNNGIRRYCMKET